MQSRNSEGKLKIVALMTNYTLHHEDIWASGCEDEVLLTTALVSGEWSTSLSCRFTP
jgi:hypothetical protein